MGAVDSHPAPHLCKNQVLNLKLLLPYLPTEVQAARGSCFLRHPRNDTAHSQSNVRVFLVGGPLRTVKSSRWVGI